ncbi:MAG: Stage II sporulation protein M [Candidatus Dichloromethanomonas elyunquensis]|nr:MAG: Stage II sporulation protein M [Candidatus Dichloromethanomonas elyunquensis]
MKKILFEHIRQYWVIYLTLSSVFLAGGVFGAVGSGVLDAQKTDELSKFLLKLLGEQPNTVDSAFLQKIAKDYFLMMAGIWILGLTVIGTPLVYLIVFSRGFILGFTIAFIIQVKSITGLGLVFFTIFLPSILVIPCLLLGAGLATIFSFLLLQGKSNGDILRKDFLYYSAASLFISLGSVSAGVLQGYFSIVGTRFLGF